MNLSPVTILGMTLIGLQLPVQAETWWLVGFANSPAYQIFTLPMENEQQCEVSGSKIVASAKAEALSRDMHGIGFVCVKGK